MNAQHLFLCMSLRARLDDYHLTLSGVCMRCRDESIQRSGFFAVSCCLHYTFFTS
jgi:hypothetical protein